MKDEPPDDNRQTDWLSHPDPAILRRPETKLAGERARDAGIKRAADHADDVTPKWGDTAYAFLCDWLLRRDEPFQTCEARWAADGIVPDPPDARAWGHVARRAFKAGLIVAIGTAPDLDPKSHRSPCNVWRKSRRVQ